MAQAHVAATLSVVRIINLRAIRRHTLRALLAALSLGGDGAWRKPMGIVVIGGLLLSTALTLLIVPAAFSLADGIEKRLGPKLRRSLLTYEPEHGDEARARDAGAGGVLPAE
jgi:hypothetical protein